MPEPVTVIPTWPVATNPTSILFSFKYEYNSSPTVIFPAAMSVPIIKTLLLFNLEDLPDPIFGMN